MTYQQKKETTAFFEKVIKIANEGGIYFWPDKKEIYTIKNGKFFAKKSAITKIKNVTVPSFHKKLAVKHH